MGKLKAAMRLAVAAAAVACGIGIAQAAPEAYPQKVVTLVTHSSPGGGSDVFLREMIKYLNRYIDATFVVENVQGGSGARAMSKVATSKPDGATFYAITPTYVFTSLMSKVPSTYKDMQPVVTVFSDAEVLFTRTDGPFKSLKDVIAHAKEKRGRWGVANPASLERQAAERLKKAAGVNAAIVSHEGGGDMMINVLNGTLDVGVGEIQELRSQLEAGKVRLVATFNSKRLDGYPNVPTVKEEGFDVVVQKFRGLAGPKGQPPEVLAIWERAMRSLIADPDYKKVYAAESLVPEVQGSAGATKLVDDFAAESEAFLKEAGAAK
ncbi:tripartite tricarboxylate transporter substrate binding protein [Alsobacter sp. KACC 23698]|uniref:Tripartite tricarboxylate transporter substrate binding protein n=1 Tax=Alsobacter sp. KACC 23698 TaxID=3149229 RepID=A0AAU7JKW9_9HYPH